MSDFEVYKFGGASIKDSYSIRNMYHIVKDAPRPLILVFSAMGKTTNALEKIAEKIWLKEYSLVSSLWNDLRNYFFTILADLELTVDIPIDFIYRYTKNTYISFDSLYDAVVSEGEKISTCIINAFFKQQGCSYFPIDITNIIITDGIFRQANVQLGISKSRLHRFLREHPSNLYITQGFIGGTRDGYTTTLGRESSDYSATLIGSFVNASRVTIWKDVRGLYDKDPKIFTDAKLYSTISYDEAEKLSISGAQIIHPRAIAPLKDKGIPLYVRPFSNPKDMGTIVH